MTSQTSDLARSVPSRRDFPQRLLEEFGGAAAGRADVAYSFVDSPIGRLAVAATKRGLVRLAFRGERVEDFVWELSETISPRVIESHSALDKIRRQLDEYFEGRRSRFEMPIDWQLTRGFALKVLKATSRIPFGEVSTYSQVAARAGNPKAYRAAGNALGSNRIPIVVPCHRVLHADGGLGGYGGGLDMKEFLLRLEGSF
ncbi:MAG: methylated-DNA--[protein]-cysteine S-methyltransferase [Actinomycetota bacterium]|nr:methylated-DNA--[protein]-cysteine S-methyltransferase [Actinomycetota bacterium]